MAYSNETSVFREQFNVKVGELLGKKRDDNSAILTRERYDNLIATVKNIKVKQKKEPVDYRRIARYDILVVGDREMLIKPIKDTNSAINYYVASDELFNVLHDTHINIGHAGRNKMVQELKTMYCNVTAEVIMIYLSLCQHCNQKKSVQAKKVVPSKSSVTVNLNSRGQVDLIDMESKSCGENRYVMVYQDHVTKFVLLKALQTNNVEEVAHHLLDIFTTIGAPAILQSDIGRNFCIKVIKSLRALWKDLKLVHGNPQVQSQAANIENMLVKWMKDNKSSDWVTGLKILQFTRNRTYNEELKKSPFEAMFGGKAKVGLTSLLEDQLEQLETEEDLERVMHCLNESRSSTVTSEEITEEPGPSMMKQEICIVCDKPTTSVYSCVECGGTVHETCMESCENQDDLGCTVICSLCSQPNKRMKNEPDVDTF